MKARILELHALGASYRQIQAQLGCSKGTIAYHLGVGQKLKATKRQRDRRNHIRKFLQEYKASHPCVDCKEHYPYWIMQFDHLRDKNFTIGAFRDATSNLDIVKLEIEKCDVICSNCHANRTFNRRLKHGADIRWIPELEGNCLENSGSKNE